MVLLLFLLLLRFWEASSGFQRFPEIPRGSQRLLKVSRRSQRLPEVSLFSEVSEVLKGKDGSTLFCRCSNLLVLFFSNQLQRVSTRDIGAQTTMSEAFTHLWSSHRRKSWACDELCKSLTLSPAKRSCWSSSWTWVTSHNLEILERVGHVNYIWTRQC